MSRDDEASGPFSRTALWVIIPVAVVSLIVTIALTVIGDDLGGRPSAGADAYSRSAIGTRGIVELLRRLDVPVVVSRNESAAKAKHGLLVIAEPVLPDATGAAAQRLRAEIGAASRVLIVLPKWYGVADHDGHWIEDAGFLPIEEINPLFGALGITASVNRDNQPRRWRDATGDEDADDTGHDEVHVSIREPQSLHSESVTAMISDGNDGFDAANVLLGRTLIDGTEVTILTDPDVIDNYGLRDPGNARFAVGLIDRLRDGGPVVFDEATHGFAATPSLWHALFRFPLVLATLQGLLCALLAVWAAMVRFGPLRAAPPPIAPGKDFLIRNTAALLRYGGHHGHALHRYFAASVQAVRHALHAPADLTSTALTGWLERVRAARGGTISLPELSAAVEALPARPPAHRIVELADLIYRWRLEMTHGSVHRS